MFENSAPAVSQNVACFSGDYECQVSYHEDVEKKLKMSVSLTVLGKTIDI
jgi:hypothetical protein